MRDGRITRTSLGQEIDSQIGSMIVFRCYISLWNCVSGNYAMMFHRMIIPCCDMSSDCGVRSTIVRSLIATDD